MDKLRPHTARTLVSTPSPLAFDLVKPCALDAGIRAVLATIDHPVAQAARAAQESLPWGTDPMEDLTEGSIAAVISVATLMGPKGPIPAPDVRLRLAYMRPNSYYPLHLHDADETYLIVAGQALWTADDDVRMRGVAELRCSLCAKLDISSQGELFGFLTKLSKSTSR